MLTSLKDFEYKNKICEFENELLEELGNFNSLYFPGSEFRYNLNQNNIDEDNLATEKEKEFLPKYINLVNKYSIKLKQETSTSFLDQWYIDNVRREIEQVFNAIK